MIEKIEEDNTVELNIKFWIEPVTKVNTKEECKEFVKHVKKIFYNFKIENNNFKKFFFTDTNFSLKTILYGKKSYFKQTYVFHKKNSSRTSIQKLKNNLINFLNESESIKVHFMKAV